MKNKRFFTQQICAVAQIRRVTAGWRSFMEEKQSYSDHKIMIDSRNVIIISGVNDVLSFDAKEVLLQTSSGALMIRGSELHITRLTLEKGEVDIDGKVDSLMYSDNAGYNKNGESLLNRLFK